MAKITGNEFLNPINTKFEFQPGLTIRAHFASMVLQGFVSQKQPIDVIIKQISLSVILADLLIDELNKGK